MIYVGIDPSLTHTGIVALGYTDHNENPLGLLWSHTVKTKPVDGWRAECNRRSSIALAIMAYLRDYKEFEHLIVVEGYAPNINRMGASMAQIELGAILRASLLTHETCTAGRVEFVQPASLKKFVTGKGNADKMKVAMSVMKRWNVDFGSDDNLYDAYGLAMIGAARIEPDVSGCTKEQVEAALKALPMKAIAAPEPTHGNVI